MPSSKMKPPTVPEDLIPKVFIIPNAIIDTHSQSSQHNADQARSEVSDGVLPTERVGTCPPVLVPAA